MAVLEVRDVGFLDWERLNFTVGAGECLGLAGESGSGKSLLLRAIADLDPHVGEVFLDVEACSAISAPEWRRRVGMLTAESRWWYDHVGAHFPDGAADRELFEALGFDGDVVPGWEVRRLSAGERQRLALARLVARRPEVLLLDEPTANLDPMATARVEAVVADYRESRGVPVIWVAHDEGQLERVAARRLRMLGKNLEAV